MAASAVSSPVALSFEGLDYFQLPISQGEVRLTPGAPVTTAFPGFSPSYNTTSPQWTSSGMNSMIPITSTYSSFPNVPISDATFGSFLDISTDPVPPWNNQFCPQPLSIDLKLPIRSNDHFNTNANDPYVASSTPAESDLAAWDNFDFDAFLAADEQFSQAWDKATESSPESLEYSVSPTPTSGTVLSRDSSKKPTKYKIQKTKAKYANGKSGDMFLTWTVKDKTKKPRTTEDKLKTAINRQLKACAYHQRMKKACDPTCMPYIRCITSPQPTFISALEDIRLFRRGPAVGHPLESFRTEIFELKDIQLSEFHQNTFTSIRLTQDIGPELAVLVSPFQPRPEDKLSHVWYKGNLRQESQMPAYCLNNLPLVRAGLLQYITNSVGTYLLHLIQKSGTATQSILLKAHQFALEQKSTLVEGALHLLAVNRMIEYDWHISGEERLDMTPIYDKDSPWYKKIPITPMMDTQLDQIIIQDFLTPLRNKVLEELQSKFDSIKDNLFEIFLTTFILATNTQLLLQHSRRNAIRYRAKNRYNSLQLAEEYVHGHNILLAHFHYLCYGSPLIGNGKSKMKKTHVPEEQVGYVQLVKQAIEGEDTEKARLAKEYESEMYWSHQLFLDDWRPESKHIAEIAL